jgi:hypothetical protein
MFFLTNLCRFFVTTHFCARNRFFSPNSTTFANFGRKISPNFQYHKTWGGANKTLLGLSKGPNKKKGIKKNNISVFLGGGVRG